MQRVRLGVQRDHRLRGDTGHGGVEVLLVVDEDHSASSRNPIDTNFSLNARRSKASVAASARTAALVDPEGESLSRALSAIEQQVTLPMAAE